jgi:hypothetical protein
VWLLLEFVELLFLLFKHLLVHLFRGILLHSPVLMTKGVRQLVLWTEGSGHFNMDGTHERNCRAKQGHGQDQYCCPNE